MDRSSVETRQFVRVGDAIKCTLNFPCVHELRMNLNTPESAAYANELVASGRWSKVESVKDRIEQSFSVWFAATYPGERVDSVSPQLLEERRRVYRAEVDALMAVEL